MSRIRYVRDPHWITVRYAGPCKRCDRRIVRGDLAYYYPSTRSLYCEAEACGGVAEADFEACAQDEEAAMRVPIGVAGVTSAMADYGEDQTYADLSEGTW